MGFNALLNYMQEMSAQMKTIIILFILFLSLGGFITTSVFATTDTRQISSELKLIQVLGCKGCHALAGKGGSLAVSLDHIGNRFTAIEIEKQLIHGKTNNKNFMPSYKTQSTTDIQNLSSFLYNH